MVQLTNPPIGPEVEIDVAISGGIANPTTGLTFSTIHKQRPFKMLWEGLTLFQDDFEVNASLYTEVTTGTSGTATFGGGKVTSTHIAAFDNNFLTDRQPTVPCVWAEVEILTEGTDPTFSVAAVGLTDDSNNYIHAQYDTDINELRLQVKDGGSLFFFGGNTVALTAPYKLGFALQQNLASVFYDEGNGWIESSTDDISARFDMTDPTVLDDFFFSFGSFSGGADTWEFKNFKVGLLGEIALRDMRPVTWRDGAPFIVGHKLYFTATSATPGGSWHMGVYTLDQNTFQLEKTGVLYANRSSTLHNETAGHVVFDQLLQKFHVLMSTWGGGFGTSLDIAYKLVDENVLEGLHIIENMTLLDVTLKNTGVDGVYDPFLVHNGNEWVLAYAFTDDLNFTGDPFYAVLDESMDLVNWTNIGDDSANTGYEGTHQFKVNDTWYVVAGGQTDYRVYTSSMSFLGTLTAPNPSTGDTQPWPVIYSYNRNGKNMFRMFTFDDVRYGTALFTWGNIYVMEAAETETGYEHPIRYTTRMAEFQSDN